MPCSAIESENDKENTDPLAESPTVTPKVLKTKSKVPSASTKTVWKSNNDAVLIQHFSRNRRRVVNLTRDSNQTLQGSEKTSGGVAKTSGSCHDHWGKLKKDFAVIKKLREQFGLLIVPDLECKRGICIRELYIGIIEIIRLLGVANQKLVQPLLATDGELVLEPARFRWSNFPSHQSDLTPSEN
ncbi:hypothetical protein F4604DRAFT_1907113 [Suillus subluteus]|nr:hypothetical protein F4604DRAFT_1907113 [Suillus subluteus]